MKKIQKTIIKNIAFDLLGVVFSEAHMVSNVLIPLLNNNNLQKDEVKSSYNEFTNGKINEEAFWSRLKINNYFEIRKK